MASESPLLPSKRRHLRPILLIIGVCAIALPLLLAVFYLEENWRGAHSWAACQRDLRSHGEKLDWHSFTPIRIPDERNLAMAPLFVRELHYRPDPATGTYTFGQIYDSPGKLEEMPFAGPRPDYIKLSGAESARHTDLLGYARYYRQKDGFPHLNQTEPPEAEVLQALTRYDSALDELAQAAATRPLTRFPVDWYRADVSNIRLPHYSLQQRLASTLRLRASARLAAGHEEDALSDLELCLRLSQSVGDEHMLIGALEQYTLLHMVLGTLWDGLADRRWSAGALARLQEDLQHFDPLREYPATIRRERASMIQSATFLQRRGDAWLLIDPPTRIQNPPSKPIKQLLLAVDGWIPPGWYDLNKTAAADWVQNYILGSVDPVERRIYSDKVAAGGEAMRSLPKRPTNVLAAFLVGVLESTTRHLARAQTSLDQARTACALEHFFLDHQTYPADLADLVPKYMAAVPKDVIEGLPLRYHPTPDGRFQLYSVGWNGRDDGGHVVWSAPGKLKDEEGDWVWQYTELQPPSPERKTN